MMGKSNSLFFKALVASAVIAVAGPALSPAYAGLFGPYFGGILDCRASTDEARLCGVRPNSPAAAAGLLADDVIVEFGGVTIRSVDDFNAALKSQLPGKPVEVVYIRGGKEYQTAATLEARR